MANIPHTLGQFQNRLGKFTPHPLPTRLLAPIQTCIKVLVSLMTQIVHPNLRPLLCLVVVNLINLLPETEYFVYGSAPETSFASGATVNFPHNFFREPEEGLRADHANTPNLI